MEVGMRAWWVVVLVLAAGCAHTAKVASKEAAEGAAEKTPTIVDRSLDELSQPESQQKIGELLDMPALRSAAREIAYATVAGLSDAVRKELGPALADAMRQAVASGVPREATREAVIGADEGIVRATAETGGHGMESLVAAGQTLAGRAFWLAIGLVVLLLAALLVLMGWMTATLLRLQREVARSAPRAQDP
jgi:hypothetical protein